MTDSDSQRGASLQVIRWGRFHLNKLEQARSAATRAAFFLGCKRSSSKFNGKDTSVEAGMFSLFDNGTRLCDGLTRREWLRIGGLSALGLSLPDLLRGQTASAAPAGSSFGKAKSCIVLFYLGGPPQHETWDPKDDAPSGIRGDFKSIATNVPGLRVGELMPRTARQRDRVCVLRAMSTNDNAHSSSGYWMLTGVP